MKPGELSKFSNLGGQVRTTRKLRAEYLSNKNLVKKLQMAGLSSEKGLVYSTLLRKRGINPRDAMKQIL